MLGSAADAACRQALVFALDVSSSVDTEEYRQQLEGLAGALQEPDVLDAILFDPEAPMAVAAFEWSSREYSSLIVDWTLLRSEADVTQVATRLSGWNRHHAPTETGLGTGLRVAADLLAKAPDCWEHTIDISADGKNNDGPSPISVHQSGALEEVTVNALVVGSTAGARAEAELEDVSAYLRENVASGPGAFVVVAQSYADYASAMRRKLLKEIAQGTSARPLDHGGMKSAVEDGADPKG
ncbi:DUF1194 domain-containing protein [Roseitranquillus sediminis]|uniref:DUF1194 domain-containing protein n=1 Tax=Roseitranquillus sediminis TaxID=2809051 RepID=UPI001D0C343B|nr:DUF1194 domain-containing protein [Roseitranquillus sediminis]MBM9595462.1 DUF1194 domain-containing protein [Roseitranquillus sediminis]